MENASVKKLVVQIKYSELYKREVVMVGDIELAHYHKFHRIKEFMNFVGSNFFIDEKIDYRFGSRDKCKIFTQKAGCTPSKLMKHVNALLYKFYVAKYDNFHVKKFCFKRSGLSATDLRTLEQTYPILDQVKKDGIYHVAPHCFLLRENPSQLKKTYGKGAWKKVCKNSFYRNNLLAKSYLANGGLYDDIPSSILKNLSGLHGVSHELMTYARDKLKGFWTKKQALQRKIYIVLDTKQLADRYDFEFSFNWDFEKIQQKHDEYVRKSFAIKNYVSDKTFEWYDSFEPKEVQLGPYTARLLKSQKEVVDEGQAMNHCVGMYALHVANKTYIVYSVSKGFEKYSTIGFNFQQDKLIFNQHYMSHNRPIEAEDEAALLPEAIIENFNKKGVTNA